MKYRMLASLSAVAALALGGGVAEAHNTTFQTNIELLDSYDISGNEVGVVGEVSSPRAQCVPNRTVKIFALFPADPKELVDFARTSDTGQFAGGGIIAPPADNAEAKVLRKNIGGSGHRHICQKASDTF